ncbi:MAG: DUF1624 domain-containing protein [Atopobiaceae bacterium]|jgi:uncharacterized membrane protein|nr:DUF1624 domain-containing protein [Atopobiaceae bacterium]MCH4120083.1 DUF1624 domain-containing protein [Atopobiaceae bacterium]MCI1317887.1 DUF1624 domain-containing protein [Atopobiaceae bacterium]MCI1388400.1 DUF1624 domain-containing protein [Atopobiaceae bacterium]MCI1431349.1 DUF1624 domain-containing protein [Atopobiaceae bacterium]
MAKGERVRVFDDARGILILSMVGFHACFDLVNIYGVSIPWYQGIAMAAWRDSISWPFLFIAGCMCAQSRSNLRRSAKYLLVAALIFVVTYATGIVTPISFGIIFCMGACTLLSWLLGKAHLEPKGYLMGIVLIVAFWCLRDMNWGIVHLPGTELTLPSSLYATDWWSWLGFPGPTFASGDYYPVLPYCLLYLAGTAIGTEWSAAGYPDWAKRRRSRVLEFFGRNTLQVYILHQPIIILVLTALGLG